MKNHIASWLNLSLVLAVGTLDELMLPARPPFTTESQFTASDSAADDRFGKSTHEEGYVVVVSAPFDDDLGFNAGSAYVFRRTPDGWLEQKLRAADGQAFDEFGHGVAVEGDLLVVGSPGGDSENATSSGAAYIFRWDGAQWNQET